MVRHWKSWVCTGALVATGAAVYANATAGPSSSATPYVVRMVPGVVTKSVLTVGDSALNGYRMVGIPDGLGAFDNGDGTFTLLMNHELGDTAGIVRAHGATGSLVSRWTITKDLMVLHGEDLIQSIATWNAATGTWNAPAKGIALARLCSATLPPKSAFYDAATGLGYDGWIFTNGEENGAAGRAWAHLMDGTSYELPRLGKASWENIVPRPAASATTVSIGLDDSGDGQVYVYAGTKTVSNHPVVAAGLANGTLYGIKVEGLASESDATVVSPNTPFSVVNLGDVSAKSGADLEAASAADGVTGFNRPEDGTWDPAHPNDFYFVTTASFTSRSRLWRLRFVDATTPALGGTISMLLDGTEGQRMMDNVTIDARGRLIIQEDPGNQPHIARLWQYDIARDALTAIAQHDPERFAPGALSFLTQDEESSGVIDMASILGDGWFLLDVQAHYSAGDPELVQGGQLIAMHVPPGRKY